MSRPNIVRADTLDLQDPEQPSAKDHTNQPAHADASGRGPLAPHQDASIRHMQEERSAEQEYLAEAWGSSRSSHEGSELLDEDPDYVADGRAVPGGERSQDPSPQSNGNQTRSSEDSDVTDADGDENTADDDMMDKISSSPSIDDGGSPIPYISRTVSRKALPLAFPGSGRTPRFAPPRINHHHLGGEYPLERQKSGLSDYSPGPVTRPTIMDRPRPNSRFVAKAEDDVFSPDSRDTSTSFFHPLSADTDHTSLDPHGPRQLAPMDSNSSLSSFLGTFIDYDDHGFDEAIGIQDDEEDQDDDDDFSDAPFPPDVRFVDSGWGGECLQDTEDIDFEFVYALHTFVATVEGQANATKGDTMVLLDDSNSYWWLVRVVKDASIGYLPAEHIETPTERLARLNKHRNIDLSATMLSDNLEKSKNPLKKAMRRRNAKMVQFTTPTYYEASEVDWSDGENEEDSVDLHPDPEPGDQTQQQTESEVSANSSVEHVETTTEPMKEDIATNGIRADAAESANRDVKNATESERHSEESQDDGAPSKSRNGTIRNTDSFFGDNGAEPKKMSLTPPILKRESERSSAESPRSSESKEKSPTAETFEQITAGFSPSPEKFKEEKRRKDKKPGMLSGLFRRGKDKKIKVDEAAGGTVRTQQEGDNILTSPTSISPMDTGNNSPRERSPHAVRRQVSNGKLVKSPPPLAAPSNAVSATTSGLSSGISSPPNGAAITPTSSIPSINTSMAPKSAVTTTPTSSNATPTSSNISPGTPTPRQPLRIQTQTQPPSDFEPKREGGVMSPTIGLLSSSSAGSKKSPNTPITQPQGDARDDSALEEHDDQSANRVRNAAHTPPPRTAPPAPRQQIHDEDGLVSPVDPANTQDRYLPALDPSSKAEALSESPVSPTTPTESLSNSTAHTTEPYSEAGDTGNRGAASTAPSSTAPERHTAGSRDVSEEPAASDDEPEEYAWDDVALRTYLDESSTNDVKEMLWRVHDKSDVTPIPLDHPTMVSLGYGEQQKHLDDISSRLDGLLNSFLKGSESRQRAVGAMP